MDKIFRRRQKGDQLDNKSDFKDRGDVTNEKVKRNVDVQVNTADRGDSPEKFPQRVPSHLTRLYKTRPRSRSPAKGLLSEKVLKNISLKKLDVKPFDISRRRKLAQMYTFRRVANGTVSTLAPKKEESVGVGEDTENGIKTDPVKKQPSEDIKKEALPVQSNISCSSTKREHRERSPRHARHSDRQLKRTPNRKPIIKTVTSKHTTKVYKAVTFVDQNRKKPLKISIPDKSWSPKSKSSEAKVPVKPEVNAAKEKSPKLKLKKKLRSFSPRATVYSPVLSQRAKSVVTEVAKWAPQSVDKHTKPYYEAWVDTTLTAVSRNADEKFKDTFVETVRRYIEPPAPIPEPTLEDLSDERFTGMIRITQRKGHAH